MPSCVRSSRRAPAVVCLGLAALLFFPPAVLADSVFSRAGGAIGGVFRRFTEFFLPGELDPELDRAVGAYGEGRYFTTFRHARRLLARKNRKNGVLTDEGHLLAGLAVAEAGLRDEALPHLKAVLEARKPSPYYPLALAGLLELEARLGNTRAGAVAASRYFADFWSRPRSTREAAVKAVFLETGNLAPEQHPVPEPYPEGKEIHFREDRPVDRAVYLAGMALLREKKWDDALVCFEALTARSVYFAYARYGLAQARYGLGELGDATRELGHVYDYAGERPDELFLKDRAALLHAQVLHELERDSAAIRWLRRVQRGPFALHAALLAAEIQADRSETALALVYLKERPTTDSVEPKLLARAAALDAELYRDMQDPATAVAKLEEGLRVLDRYEGRIAETSGANAKLDGVLEPLDRRSRAREVIERWRRENLANAIPELVDASNEPGWASVLLAGVLTRNPAEEGYPVIYYPQQYDPFTALPFPEEAAFEPPGDEVFPAVFRRSLGQAVAEALRYEHDLERAIEGKDDFHLAMLTLDGDLRLSAASGDAEVAARTIEALGLGEAAEDALRDRRPRGAVLAKALTGVDPRAVRERRDAIRTAARDMLTRWRAYERALVREALGEETKAVQELRLALAYELSQTLLVKQSEEKRLRSGDGFETGS